MFIISVIQIAATFVTSVAMPLQAAVHEPPMSGCVRGRTVCAGKQCVALAHSVLEVGKDSVRRKAIRSRRLQFVHTGILLTETIGKHGSIVMLRRLEANIRISLQNLKIMPRVMAF